MDRPHYYCPHCRIGIFTQDKQLEVQDKHWIEGITRQAVWLIGKVTYQEISDILQEVGQKRISESRHGIPRSVGDKKSRKK